MFLKKEPHTTNTENIFKVYESRKYIFDVNFNLWV